MRISRVGNVTKCELLIKYFTWLSLETASLNCIVGICEYFNWCYRSREPLSVNDTARNGCTVPWCLIGNAINTGSLNSRGTFSLVALNSNANIISVLVVAQMTFSGSGKTTECRLK